jgi:hypothetical protein
MGKSKINLKGVDRFNQLGFKAMKEAVVGAIEEHKKFKLPLVVMEKGRVIRISPFTLKPVR